MNKSKLHLKTVRAKNFRSFGAQFIEIDLTQPKTLVVSGDNGAGKSTGLTHALTFVFFDKAYQKGQKKTSLLNSKNGKECMVEVEFETKGHDWKVRRGIKPNVFEIYKDGVIVSAEAAGKDYQAYLIDILGMDDKVFFNTVVLGRDKFVPFNEMSASDTRNFVEVLLDLGVFSRMNEITKEDIKAVTREITDNGYSQGKVETDIAAACRVIGVLEDSKRSKQADNAGLLADANGELAELLGKIVRAEALRDNLQKQESAFASDLVTKTDKMYTLLLQLNSKKSVHQHTRDNFMSMTTCPTCEQVVSDDRKHEVDKKLTPEITTLEGGIVKLKAQWEPEKERVDQLKEVQAKLLVANNGLSSLKNITLPMIERRIVELSKSGDTTDEEAKIAAEQVQLTAFSENLKALKDYETGLLKKKTDLTALLTFLKDDGVKSDIAKIYIPVLNQKVNQFLDALNLWVNITIDEEFGMTMFAPDRKGQSISDLSTGQMRRIDLAMLLAWRDVAQMKSSVDTNLLIMDETLENLSAQGVADFVEFIENAYKGDMSLFVISQRKDEFSAYFDNVIEFALKDDFSYLVDIL